MTEINMDDEMTESSDGVNVRYHNIPNLSWFERQEIEIVDVDFYIGKWGRYAVITLRNGGVYKTHSKLVVHKLRRLKHEIKENGIRTMLVIRPTAFGYVQDLEYIQSLICLGGER
jgi:hypothetical protein